MRRFECCELSWKSPALVDPYQYTAGQAVFAMEKVKISTDESMHWQSMRGFLRPG
jgi:hypothetical protein